jgi:hypothetical protein
MSEMFSLVRILLIIENKNSNDRFIKERIQTGNKAYYANLQMLKSKIISRRYKLQIYKTLIRPVVIYGAETWTLTATEENALRRFERKVLRKIYGPVVNKGIWRIRYNNEMCKLMGREDIVRFITAQRIQWLSHVERVDETAMPKRVLNVKLYATRRIGRPRIRWLEYVIADLRRMELVDGWRRQEIGISGGGSLRRPRPTQGCNAEQKKSYTVDVKGTEAP